MTWPLFLDMARGKYLHLGQRPVTEYDWWVLWMLAHETVNKVNLSITPTVPNETCTGIDDTLLT